VVKEPNYHFALGMMFAISTKLTLFVLIFMPISGYIISKLAEFEHNHTQRKMDHSYQL
jgi:subfamily B ATP-binding cassette protein MsbA